MIQPISSRSASRRRERTARGSTFSKHHIDWQDSDLILMHGRLFLLIFTLTLTSNFNIFTQKLTSNWASISNSGIFCLFSFAVLYSKCDLVRSLLRDPLRDALRYWMSAFFDSSERKIYKFEKFETKSSFKIHLKLTTMPKLIWCICSKS